MRICFVLTSLGAGGAERVASTLANEWVSAGHEVCLVTLAPAEVDHYPLDSRVQRRPVGLLTSSRSVGAAVVANGQRLRRLRREFRAMRPDVIVSFMDTTNVLVLIAAAGTGIPVVVSERNDPRMYSIGPTWESLRRLTYPFASQLVVQTQSVAAWGRSITDPYRVAVIPNPVADACLELGRRAARPRAPRIVAVGRLVHQKGFDTLIAAFDAAALRHTDWSLVIAGQGPLEAVLKAQASAARSADRIAFAGLLHNPGELLASSEIFVLSSRFEGFPNALAEAMACGCAVISTDCPSGPAEIVTGGVDGLLVPVDDVDRMAGALDRLMADDPGRQHLGRSAMESADRFRAGRIAAGWIARLMTVRGLVTQPQLALER